MIIPFYSSPKFDSTQSIIPQFHLFYCVGLGENFKKFIKSSMSSSSLDFLFLNSRLIVEPSLCIEIALNMAIKNSKNPKIQIISNLSHTNGIRESLSEYGYSQDNPNCLFVLFGEIENFSFESQLECERFGSLEDYNLQVDIERLKKNFDFSSHPSSSNLQCHNILPLLTKAIINTMSTKFL